MAQQGVRYIWIMAIFLVLSFSASWAGVHTHLPRGVNAANDTVEVDAGDKFIAAKAYLDTTDADSIRARALVTTGKTTLGDAATDTLSVVSDSNFVTGGAVIGIAGGVRQRYVDSTVDSLRFTNGSVTFAGGNVGIGTTLPTTPLQVTATAVDVSKDILRLDYRDDGGPWSLNNYAGLSFQNLARIAIYPDAASSFGLSFYTTIDAGANTPERMRITSAGNVGIGTTGPDTRLDLSGGTLSMGPLNGAGEIRFRTAIANSASGGIGITALDHSGANVDGLGIYGYDGISFLTAQTEWVRITSAGNVGIGTTGPDGKLSVFTASAGTVSAHTSADELVLENSGETGMSFLGGNTSDLSIYFGDEDSNVQGSIVYANNGNKLGFGTAGTGNKMVINSAGKILIATSAAPTNAEVAINGELVLGDGATDNNHDLRINAGASYSEIIAGEVQFAVSSLSDLKTAIKPLMDVTSLRSAFRDSTTVKTWQWKRETLYQQRIVDEIMADSLRIPDLVLKEMMKREKIQVDTDTAITARVDTLVSISSRDSVIALVVIDSLGEVVTSTKIATYYDTLRTIETHYDTTWTPILYTVTSPEKKTIADSIRTAVVDTATAKVVAYNAKIDAQAGRQHIGIMAEDAYRIARIIAPEAAEPNVVDGNIIQAALVQMAIAHECELDSLKTVISALQNRVDALQIDLNARLKILEAK